MEIKRWKSNKKTWLKVLMIIMIVFEFHMTRLLLTMRWPFNWSLRTLRIQTIVYFSVPTKQGIYDILFKTDSTQTYSGFYATFQIHTEGYQQDYIATKCTAVCPPFDPWKNCPNYKFCFHGYERDQCGCQTCQCLPAINGSFLFQISFLIERYTNCFILLN